MPSILPFCLSLQGPSKNVSPTIYHLSPPFPLLHTKGLSGQVGAFGLSDEDAFFSYIFSIETTSPVLSLNMVSTNFKWYVDLLPSL